MAANAAPASIEQIQSALSYVSPEDRDIWVTVAMAVKSELGDDGFWVWDDWSNSSDSYHAGSARSVWKSVKPGGRVNIGKLFQLAKAAGWTWDKPEKKLTKAQIEALREASRVKAEAAAAEKAAEQAIAAERAREIWNAAEPVTVHPYLTRKQVESFGLRVGPWEVVDHQTGELTLLSSMALLVPIKDRTGAIFSLQAIFPNKIGGRKQDNLKGGAKSGNFFAIGKTQEFAGRRVFVLAEGYATAASIHMATQHCVLACIDAGNILPVAVAIRERQPEAIILLAADNDQFKTPNRNPGVEAATRAALEVGGLVAVPQFASLDGKPTDFNDLHVREGLDVVAAQIQAALDGDMPTPEPELEEPTQPEATPAVDPPVLKPSQGFTVLGYDHGKYYLFVHAKQQIMEYTISDFANTGKLLEIYSDINFWEMEYPSGKDGKVNFSAIQTMVASVAHQRGVYDPARVRGRGAWIDKGRQVFHHGGYLTVDGVSTAIPAMQSAYIYPMGKAFIAPADEALSADEGKWLLSVAERIRWRADGSGKLMAGWVMLAPICGALKWRPHIWITGAAGSGKTVIQRDFCASLLRGVSLMGDGNSTEPGIRQTLQSDSVPVLLDELESNNDVERRRVEGIIAMVRKSSSETQAVTLKGTSSGEGSQFMIRSMFCLCSINVNLPGKADVDRLTRLTIKPPAPGGEAHWKELEAQLHKISNDETISQRLLARALRMMPVIHQNVSVFIKAAAAAAVFGTQRHGDQYGTLLAGCWSLVNDHVASEAEAAAFLAAHTWEEHTEDNSDDDAMNALQELLNAKIRMPGSLGDFTVFELVRDANPDTSFGKLTEDDAGTALQRHGIRLKPEFENGKNKWFLLFGTSVPNLKKLLNESACSTDIRGQFLRLPGATKWGDKTVKFNGAASKCIAVPLGLIFDESPQDDDYPI
jgi:putative DNA primase/helicase